MYAILAIAFVGLVILPGCVYCQKWLDLVEKIEGVDPADCTKDNLKGCEPKHKMTHPDYEIKTDSVYYQSELIEGADPDTFRVMGNILAKDKYNVYLGGVIMDKVDPSSVEILKSFWVKREVSGYVLKDKDYVYNADGSVVFGADASSFEYVASSRSTTFFKDDNNVYRVYSGFFEEVPSELPSLHITSYNPKDCIVFETDRERDFWVFWLSQDVARDTPEELICIPPEDE